MYALRLIGWMLVTLGVCGLVFPSITTNPQATDTYTVSSVVMCVVVAALGGFILAKTRRAS